MRAAGAAPGGGAPGHGSIENGDTTIIGRHAGARQSLGAERRLHYFALLSPEQQRKAVRRLARAGMGASTIAAAAQISVEQVREVLGQAETTP